MKANVKDVFVLGEPSFRVNMQKWPKTLYLFNIFVLIKGIYRLCRQIIYFFHKVDIMSLHLIIIRSFSQLWIVNSGFIQQLGEKSPNDYLILVLWLFSIILHSNYS